MSWSVVSCYIKVLRGARHEHEGSQAIQSMGIVGVFFFVFRWIDRPNSLLTWGLPCFSEVEIGKFEVMGISTESHSQIWVRE